LCQGTDARFEVECVGRLSEGLARLGQGGIEVVLLDLWLPDSEGLESFHRVYAQAQAVPIIVLTGTDDENLAVSAVQAGAQDYLVKQRFDAPLLVRAVRYGIERAQMIAALHKARDELERRVAERTAELSRANEVLKAEIAERQRVEAEVVRRNQELASLSRRLVEVQEAERRHLARELHDEVGQLLTGLKLVLEMSARLPTEESRANLAEAQALVGELMSQVRQLSLELRPGMLDDLGLLSALLWHFERYTAQTKVRVNFKHLGLERRRFAPEIETAAYRIVQEALTNVARHAGVSEVNVKIWSNAATLCVQIEDQGRGFNPQAALAASASSGVAGMRERARLLGGELMIESAPGAGACLTAELPLVDAVHHGKKGAADDKHPAGG
jgi:signal transduction histidine kinase